MVRQFSTKMTMKGNVSAAIRFTNIDHPCCVVLVVLVIVTDLLTNDRLVVSLTSISFVQSLLTESMFRSGVWLT